MMQRGLFVVLGAFAGYVLFGTFSALGMAGVVVNLITPLPAAYVGMRGGWKYAAATVALTGLLVLSSADIAATGMYLVQFGVPGAALPWLLKRNIAWDKAAALVLWGMIAASLCGLVAVSFSTGQSPLSVADEMISKEVTRTATMMQEMLTSSELTAEQRREVDTIISSMSLFLTQAYPGIAITVSGMMVLSLVFLLSLMARGYYQIPGKAFPDWKAPEQMVWILIIAGFTVAFVDGLPGVTAKNLLVILIPIYFLQGLAVIDCFLRRKSFSPLARGLGYIVVTLINPLPMLVTGLGVFDLWADFRKPREPES